MGFLIVAVDAGPCAARGFDRTLSALRELFLKIANEITDVENVYCKHFPTTFPPYLVSPTTEILQLFGIHNKFPLKLKLYITSRILPQASNAINKLEDKTKCLKFASCTLSE